MLLDLFYPHRPRVLGVRVIHCLDPKALQRYQRRRAARLRLMSNAIPIRAPHRGIVPRRRKPQTMAPKTHLGHQARERRIQKLRARARYIQSKTKAQSAA